MTKWMIYILLAIVIVPTTLAAVPTIHCQVGTDNLTWKDVNLTTYAGEVGISEGRASAQNLEESTLYYFRCRNSSSEWGHASARTEEGVKMLSVTLPLSIFGIIFIVIGLYLMLKGHNNGN